MLWVAFSPDISFSSEGVHAFLHCGVRLWPLLFSPICPARGSGIMTKSMGSGDEQIWDKTLNSEGFSFPTYEMGKSILSYFMGLIAM